MIREQHFGEQPDTERQSLATDPDELERRLDEQFAAGEDDEDFDPDSIYYNILPDNRGTAD